MGKKNVARPEKKGGVASERTGWVVGAGAEQGGG